MRRRPDHEKGGALVKARRLEVRYSLNLLEEAGILLAVGARAGGIGFDQRKRTQFDKRRFGVGLHEVSPSFKNGRKSRPLIS
jgi:predicted transcriptional regulator